MFPPEDCPYEYFLKHKRQVSVSRIHTSITEVLQNVSEKYTHSFTGGLNLARTKQA